MKRIVPLTLASLLAFGVGSALSQEFVKGQIMKVDPAQKKLTIKHGELKNLGMPAMTMVFVVADEAMLDRVKKGQAVEFTADRVNGRITVTQIK